MIVCLDVDYRSDHSATACVVFQTWADGAPVHEQVTRRIMPAAEYEPGAFYRRELPCLLDALAVLPFEPRTLIVDGFVWLGPGRPGLGARLQASLATPCPVVGVAKTSYRGATSAIPVLRGTSKRPLFITAVGMDAGEAADAVRSMHGAHRMPTMLKRADQLARAG